MSSASRIRKLRGIYLFEPTPAVGNAHFLMEAQMVEVTDGVVDLYVEHRGAEPSILWPADLMLGELRQLAATKVTTTQRSTEVCNAVYRLGADNPLTGAIYPTDRSRSVGKANPLSFTLAGEYVEDINWPNPLMTGGACSQEAEVTRPDCPGVDGCCENQFTRRGHNCKVTVGSESMLDICMASVSMTVLDGEGFPLHYLTPECLEKYRTNVGACDRGAARVSEPETVDRPDHLTLPAIISRGSPYLEVQLSRRQAVVSRLPEHLRCVLPDECGQMTLTIAQLGEAVELILKYEDCFVGDSGKEGWTDGMCT